MKLRRSCLLPFSNKNSPSSSTATSTTTTSTTSSGGGLPSESDSTSLEILPSVPSLQRLHYLPPSSMQSTDEPPSTQTLVSTEAVITHCLPHPISALALSLPVLYAASGSQLHLFHLSFSSSDSPKPSLSLIHSFPSLSSKPAPIKSICFSPHDHSNTIFTAHQDGKIRVWQLKHNSHNNNESSSSSSPEQKTLSLTHRLVVVLPTAVDKLRRFPLPRNYVRVHRHKKRLWIHHNDAVSALASLTVSTTNRDHLVYSVSWDKCLKVWCASDFKCLQSVTAHQDAVNAIAVSRIDTGVVVVYTGSADGSIRVWLRKGRATGSGSSSSANRNHHVLVATLEKHKSAVNALALMDINGSSNLNSSVVLFSGACDRSILVWVREEAADDTSGGVNYNMVVAGTLKGHGKAVLCLVTVGDDMLLSGSADRTVRMWRRVGLEIGNFSCLLVLEGHQKPVKSLVVASEESNSDVNEKRSIILSMFSGGLDGEIRLWQVKVPTTSALPT